MSPEKAAALFDALGRKPRERLGHFPTPIESAPRLSSRLGVTVFVKRDDQTGLALGGNKVRKLEFLLGDALAHRADVIITTGGTQSNHARLTAAACRRLGLGCYLILDRGQHAEDQGNMLLDRLLGAEVRIIDSPDPTVATEEMQILAAELTDAGRRPYVIPRGGSVPAGATGYVAMIAEYIEQLSALDRPISHMFLGTGSTGTHSGALAGVVAAGIDVIVQGVSVSRPEALQTEKVLMLANATLRHLELQGEVEAEEVLVDDRFRGPGYGIPTGSTMEAIEIAARDEGLILDPVYTGKVMAGLIGHAREQRFEADDAVLFVHTGGAPALFAYHAEMSSALQTGRM